MKRKTPARSGASKRGSSVSPAAHPLLSPALGVVDPLSDLLRWARVHLHDRIVAGTGTAIDRSAVVILDTLHHDGPMRLSMLAARIGLDRSTVSRQVAAVVASGLVDKTDDSSDARAAVLSLSARGQTVRQSVAHAWQAIAIELIDDWSFEEQVEFGRLMSKLAHRLREEVTPER